MITMATAIRSLRPGAEWVLEGDDVKNIVWLTEGAKPVTQKEVTAEIARLEAQEKADAAARAQARAAAVKHAKSLGFTDEMIAVMYPNLVTIQEGSGA